MKNIPSSLSLAKKVSALAKACPKTTDSTHFVAITSSPTLSPTTVLGQFRQSFSTKCATKCATKRLRSLRLGQALAKASAFSFALLLFSVITGFAQCGKDVVLTSSKTEYLNAEGAVQRTVEEDCVIKVGKSEVTISPSGHDKMTGSITSTACEWKQPFKEGKTTLEAKFKDEKGEESNATITIEGKDGKITCLMKEKDKPDRIIRVTIVKFEKMRPS